MQMEDLLRTNSKTATTAEQIPSTTNSEDPNATSSSTRFSESELRLLQLAGDRECRDAWGEWAQQLQQEDCTVVKRERPFTTMFHRTNAVKACVQSVLEAPCCSDVERRNFLRLLKGSLINNTHHGSAVRECDGGGGDSTACSTSPSMGRERGVGEKTHHHVPEVASHVPDLIDNVSGRLCALSERFTKTKAKNSNSVFLSLSEVASLRTKISRANAGDVDEVDEENVMGDGFQRTPPHSARGGKSTPPNVNRSTTPPQSEKGAPAAAALTTTMKLLVLNEDEGLKLVNDGSLTPPPIAAQQTGTKSATSTTDLTPLYRVVAESVATAVSAMRKAPPGAELSSPTLKNHGVVSPRGANTYDQGNTSVVSGGGTMNSARPGTPGALPIGKHNSFMSTMSDTGSIHEGSTTTATRRHRVAAAVPDVADKYNDIMIVKKRRSSKSKRKLSLSSSSPSTQAAHEHSKKPNPFQQTFTNSDNVEYYSASEGDEDDDLGTDSASCCGDDEDDENKSIMLSRSSNSQQQRESQNTNNNESPPSSARSSTSLNFSSRSAGGGAFAANTNNIFDLETIDSLLQWGMYHGCRTDEQHIKTDRILTGYKDKRKLDEEMRGDLAAEKAYLTHLRDVVKKRLEEAVAKVEETSAQIDDFHIRRKQDIGRTSLEMQENELYLKQVEAEEVALRKRLNEIHSMKKRTRTNIGERKRHIEALERQNAPDALVDTLAVARVESEKLKDDDRSLHTAVAFITGLEATGGECCASHLKRHEECLKVSITTTAEATLQMLNRFEAAADCLAKGRTLLANYHQHVAVCPPPPRGSNFNTSTGGVSPNASPTTDLSPRTGGGVGNAAVTRQIVAKAAQGVKQAILDQLTDCEFYVDRLDHLHDTWVAERCPPEEEEQEVTKLLESCNKQLEGFMKIIASCDDDLNSSMLAEAAAAANNYAAPRVSTGGWSTPTGSSRPGGLSSRPGTPPQFANSRTTPTQQSPHDGKQVPGTSTVASNTTTSTTTKAPPKRGGMPTRLKSSALVGKRSGKMSHGTGGSTNDISALGGEHNKSTSRLSRISSEVSVDDTPPPLEIGDYLSSVHADGIPASIRQFLETYHLLYGYTSPPTQAQQQQQQHFARSVTGGGNQSVLGNASCVSPSPAMGLHVQGSPVVLHSATELTHSHGVPSTSLE